MSSVAPALFDLDTWRQNQQAAVEHALSDWVPADAPAGLGEAMRYAVLDGGKRLRPLLVLATAEAVGGSPEAAMRAACAVELIHAYSLVHDDMPCMDNDVLRRGKPTVHVQFGEAQALLVGDALQALAFELLTPEVGVDPAMANALCHLGQDRRQRRCCRQAHLCGAVGFGVGPGLRRPAAIHGPRRPAWHRALPSGSAARFGRLGRSPQPLKRWTNRP